MKIECAPITNLRYGLMDLMPENFNFPQYFGQYGFDKNKEYVAFYGNKGQDMFGNFWRMKHLMSYNGISADNVEALYHSCKFTDDSIKMKFDRLAPLDSFYLSRRYRNNVRADWESVKEGIMMDLLRIKFKNPLAATVLLSTYDRYLVEHNPVRGRDDYWSNNHDDTGQNKLGLLLMKVRGELHGIGIVEKPADYLAWIGKQN